MKTLSNILLVLLFSVSVVFSQQQNGIPSENGWEFVYDAASITDSSKTSSSLEGEGQVFRTYGNVYYNTEWYTQTDWVKDLWESPILHDTLCINCRLVSQVNASEVWISYAFQGTFGWYAGSGKKISMDSTKWQEVRLDVSWIRKKIGPQRFNKIYLCFQPLALDSCYIGAEVMLNKLSGIDSLGNEEIYDDFKGPIATPVGVERIEGQIPKRFVLEQNYPNPFNPTTTIKFTVLEKGQVNLTVYNLLGQEVKTLVSEEKQKGSYEVVFNAANLPSGTYFYRLQIGSSVETKKMLLVK
ncbi:MAG: T9SS type A sorting domain-containing protein [Candidatus Paceibacterota bacterium]